MYGVKFELGLWCLTVRATGHCYYSLTLSDILGYINSPVI
jgi:hypothetical protein